MGLARRCDMLVVVESLLRDRTGGTAASLQWIPGTHLQILAALL